MRIAIVNDMPLAVEVLRRVIASAPEHSVAWIALNGREAVEKCRLDRPDLVLMDLIMPVMDGVQATTQIMRSSPCPVLVVTSTVSGNAAMVFEAMGHGALDAVGTPAFGADMAIVGGQELLRKIGVIEKLQIKGFVSPQKAVPARSRFNDVLPPRLVAIGSSTGGPKALVDILSVLPPRLGAAFVIVQHVDASFAPGLATWLNDLTPLRVELAREGSRPLPDTVLVAGTNDHLVIGTDMCCHYTPEPRDYPYRPSVNTFFASLEQNWPRPGVAIILTGMGKDGARGLSLLRRAGWHTIAQDKETSVVYGMPAAAAEMNAAAEILPVNLIAAAILRRLETAGNGASITRKEQ